MHVHVNTFLIAKVLRIWLLHNSGVFNKIFENKILFVIVYRNLSYTIFRAWVVSYNFGVSENSMEWNSRYSVVCYKIFPNKLLSLLTDRHHTYNNFMALAVRGSYGLSEKSMK